MSFALTSLYLVALLLPQAPSPERQAPVAPVTGRVIDADTQSPIAEARVMLMPDFRGGPMRMPFGPSGGPNGLTQAITDGDGVFTFDGVPPGRYRVEVQKPGFTLTNEPADRRTVTVTAGKPTPQVDVLLKRGGVITGRVLGANGEPMAEVMVTAMKPMASNSDLPMFGTVQMAQTNDVGEFRLASLAEGSYLVIASPRPQFPFGQQAVAPQAGGTALVPTYYPGVTDKDGAQAVAVVSAQTVNGIEITMLAAAVFSVSGVVVDESGAPQAGAMVNLMSDVRAGGPMMPAMGHTDQSGQFHINGVASGTYKATAVVPMNWNGTQSAVAGAPIAIGGAGFVAGFSEVARAGAAAAPAGAAPGGSAQAAELHAFPGLPATVDLTVADADVTGVRIVLRKGRSREAEK
jgi:protocatechuate 3,4-dioxygenase beta subunit